MNKLRFLLIFLFHVIILFGQNDFSFVFLPDIHLCPDLTVEANFNMIVNQINELNPDFVILGGDMADNAKRKNEKEAKVLFKLVGTELRQLEMPVYYTLGNHDIVGVLPESGMKPTGSHWGKGMYERLYGKTYRSFIYSDWKFFILDGIKVLKEERLWTPEIDSVRMEWIKKELLLTDPKTPICIVIHTPLINPLAIYKIESRVLSKNSKAVLDLFQGYNLKMVLQGHNHIYMNLLINGIHFISGGSTSHLTDLKPFDDGFVFIKVKEDGQEIKFIRQEVNVQ